MIAPTFLHRLLLTSLAIVGCGSIFAAVRTGYGTQFSQLATLLPYGLAWQLGGAGSYVPSASVVLLAVLTVNVLAYATCAVPLYVALRRWAPRTLVALLVTLLTAYLALLLVLFPATIGP